MKKKTILIFIVILVFILGVNLVAYYAKKNAVYDSAEDYIAKELNNKTIEIIESDNYYYIFGYGENQNESESILYCDAENDFRIIKQNSRLYTKAKIITVSPPVKMDDILVCKVYRIENDYLVFAEMVMDNRDYVGTHEYKINDNYGQWQYFERNENDGRTRIKTFFTVVQDTQNYAVFLSIDGSDNELLTGDELEYFFSKGISSKDIREYWAGK